MNGFHEMLHWFARCPDRDHHKLGVPNCALNLSSSNDYVTDPRVRGKSPHLDSGRLVNHFVVNEREFSREKIRNSCS
jgi:hypothetical protein